MSAPIPHAPQGNVPAIGIPDSQDIPRLVFSAPYFEQVPLAELIEPAVIEAAEDILPSLVPPYVDAAAQAAVQQLAVLLTGSTMTGPLFLSPLMPTQPSQAATMAYVDSMIATAGIPEVPPVPSGQVWARETGQWVPITPQTGVFLPLSGGSMTGNINMSGNTIQNMAAVPAMPNGAAPAQWVLNQIASVSLYQGTWDADTNVPDLTQLSTHVNAYTWIAITTAVDGVVIGPAIPGLQGMTVFNGDTIIYSTVQGSFMSIHAGGLSLPEADARYVQLAGSQMSGALLLNANASQPLQAVTLQQLQAFVPPGAVGEAPNDGQLYGRNGLTASWAPVLPLAGGILTGSLTLAGNATANLNPVPLQQMTSAISAATAGYLPLAGGTMSGLMTLSGNASVGLNPVPLQQLNSMLGAYAPLSGGTFTGPVTLPTGSTIAGYLPLSGGTLTGALTLAGNAAANLQPVTLQQLQAGYLPLTGGSLSGGLTINAGSGMALTVNTTNANGVSANTAIITSTNFISGAGHGLVFGTTANGTIANSGTGIITVTAPANQINYVGSAGTAAIVFGLAPAGGIAYPAATGIAAPVGVAFLWQSPSLGVYGSGTWVGNLTPSTSDPRLKSNIGAPTVDALNVLSQITLQQFDLRMLGPDDPAPQHWDLGFMSDQLSTLIPISVTPGDGTRTYDTVSLLPLMAYVVGAIQELGNRVSALDGKPL